MSPIRCNYYFRPNLTYVRSGKMLLVRNVENDVIDDYFRAGLVILNVSLASQG